MVSAGASSQTYPTRTVRLVVVVAPGGNLDLVGRSAAQHLSTAFGRQVIVENRPGANSTIGLDNVARSAADGYTLGMIAPSFLVPGQHLQRLGGSGRNAAGDPRPHSW
jgi:tripartite-type tricarboxylate transporter receptor subunit TctC